VKQPLPEAGWEAQRQTWRDVLARLAEQFAAGAAQVAPKHGYQTCRNCALQPFCRIHERMDTDMDESGAAAAMLEGAVHG
jgi:hypothetical protein